MLSENNILKQTSNNFSNLSINTSPSPTSSVNTNTTSSSHISTSTKSSLSSTNSTNSTHSTQSTQSASPTNSDTTNSLNHPQINNLTHDRQERRRRLSDPGCFPKLYEAYLQARVRSGWQLSSTRITDLPRGSVVTVEEIKGNRARISEPIHGWLSIISKNGDTILMKLSKETAKIGGKVLFSKHYFKNKNKSSMTAKIVGYNERIKMHQVRHKDGKFEWIDLRNRHIHYIPQNQIYSKMIDPVRKSEDFFVQFFKEDYPEFVHKPRPKRKNDWNNNNIKLSKYKMNEYKFDEYGNNGYIANDLVFKYKNNGNNTNKHNKNINNSKHLNLGDGYYGHDLMKIQKQLRESQNKILHSLNGRYNKYGNNINHNNNNNHHNGILNIINNNNNYKKAKIIAMKQQQQQQLLLQKQQKQQKQLKQQKQQKQKDVEVKEEEEEKKTTPKNPKCTCHTCNDNGKTKCNPEFNKKIKEIEQKIIDHLHKRGYYEYDPRFWQYIRKAKQLAIERAKKERAKILAQRQAKQQQQDIKK